MLEIASVRVAAFLVGGCSVLVAVACGSSHSADSGSNGTSSGTSGQAGHAAGGATANAGSTSAGRSGAPSAGAGGAITSGSGGRGQAGSTTAGTGAKAGTSGQGGRSGDGGAGAGESGAGGEGGQGGETEWPLTPGGGQITFASIKQESKFTQLSAGFWPPSEGPPAANPCRVETYGPCTATFCPAASSDPPPAAVKAPDAGELTISSSAASYQKTLYPDANGVYAGDVDQNVAFLGGEMLAISAEGNEVPAFSHTTTAPEPLVVDTSALPPRDSTHFFPYDPTQDLVLDFTGGTDDVRVELQGSGAPSSMFCFWDSKPGTITIPAAALTALGGLGSFYLFTLQNTTVQAGDYGVVVVVGLNMNGDDDFIMRFKAD